MKYVLVICSSIDETVDYIIEKNESDVYFFRLNVDFLYEYDINVYNDGWKISHGDIKLDSRDVISIYYRKPILPALAEYSLEYRIVAHRDIMSLINGLADSFSGKVLSKPFMLRKTENKIFQLLAARKFGLLLPNSSITNDNKVLKEFYDEKSIIKPLTTGKVKLAEKYNLHNTALLKNVFCDIRNTPVYVQEYIDKKYEVRLTIVDDQCFAVAINAFNKIDWRINSEKNHYEIIVCPESVKVQCYNILRENGLAFGAFDFIVTMDEEWIFLEFNPNGQWLWLEKLMDLPIAIAIIKYLLSDYLEG